MLLEKERERCEKPRSPTCDLRDSGGRDSPLMMGGHPFLPKMSSFTQTRILQVIVETSMTSNLFLETSFPLISFISSIASCWASQMGIHIKNDSPYFFFFPLNTCIILPNPAFSFLSAIKGRKLQERFNPFLQSMNKMHKSFTIHLTGLRTRFEEVCLSHTHIDTHTNTQSYEKNVICVSSEGIVGKKNTGAFSLRADKPTAKL